MLTNKVKSILAAVLVASTMTYASAQDTTSPYSKFGYGLLRDNATSAQRMMGSVGYAMQSGRQINVMNPASYAAIDSLTFLFDTGVTLTNMWTTQGDISRYQTGGGLDYVTMQFPVTKYMGASIGLLPYSSVGYSFGSKIDNGTSTRLGEGGLNQLYVGLAGRPFKGFSLGFNMSYLFGTTNNVVQLTPPNSGSTVFSQQVEVRDWHLEAGVQYGVNLAPKHRLTLGVVYSPAKTLLGHTRVISSELKGDNEVVMDTLLNTSLKDKFSLPETWGAGINYQWDNRLMIEADFTYQPWSKAKFTNLDNFIPTDFADRWKVGLGAQFTPKQRGSYMQRVNYRAGLYYNNDYVKVNGNQVKEWGVSCGVGLPAPGKKTVINLGFEYVNRQAHPTPLLKENYFNITLGINFNEYWFWQNKLK